MTDSETERLTSSIPNINLLIIDPSFTTAFLEASTALKLPAHIASGIKIYDYSLSQLPGSINFDLLVSPANSYGILDGGFDDAISRAFSPKNDYIALTRHVQGELYERCRGFLLPGGCEIVGYPQSFASKTRTGHAWGAKYIGLCPTMRVPGDCSWDREVVYECVWGLLCKIYSHNKKVRETAGRAGTAATGHAENVLTDRTESAIKSILMTPLGTGTGGVTAERWAHQLVLALKHFDQSEKEAGNWKVMNWSEAGKLALEVRKTWQPSPSVNAIGGSLER